MPKVWDGRHSSHINQTFVPGELYYVYYFPHEQGFLSLIPTIFYSFRSFWFHGGFYPHCCGVIPSPLRMLQPLERFSETASLKFFTPDCLFSLCNKGVGSPAALLKFSWMLWRDQSSQEWVSHQDFIDLVKASLVKLCLFLSSQQPAESNIAHTWEISSLHCIILRGVSCYNYCFPSVITKLYKNEFWLC